MVFTIRGKHFLFCTGLTQSIQCAVTQHSRAVGCHHMCPALINTHLVNPPIKPSVGYPVGSFINNCCSCQQDQPFKEDVCCCLSWLSVIVPALVQNKAPFFDTPVSCRTPCWPPNCRWLVTVLPQGNVILHFDLFFIAFLMVVGGGGGKDVEIAASADQSVIEPFCAWQHGGLLMSSGNWGHLSFTCRRSLQQTLLAIIKACILPSTTVAIDCCGYIIRLLNEGLTHHTVDCSVSFVVHWCSQKYDGGHVEECQGSPQSLLRERS